METYGVAEFISGHKIKEVSPVRMSWLVGDLDDDMIGQCFWPPRKGLTTKSLKKLLKQVEKNNNNWELYRVKILATADTYAEAAKKAERALRNTDCEASSDGMATKRKVYPTQRLVEQDDDASSTSSSDDNESARGDARTLLSRPEHRPSLSGLDDSLISRSRPQPKRQRSLPGLDDSLISTITCSEARPIRRFCSPTPSIAASVHSSVGDTSIDTSSPIRCQSEEGSTSTRHSSEQETRNNGLDTKTRKKVISLETQMKEVRQILTEERQTSQEMLAFVKRILSHFETPAPVDLPDVFPITSKEDLDGLEQMDGIYDQTVKALKIIGGNDLKDFIRRAMPRLLRNCFAEQCNLTGAKNKTPLKGTLIFKAVFGAAQMIQALDADEKKMENEMRLWLSGARDRAGGSRYKKSSDGQTLTLCHETQR